MRSAHLPLSTAEEVEAALRQRGGRRISGTHAIAGGCINHGLRLDVEPGLRFFLKWHADATVAVFEAEADGLSALARSTPLRVPEPIAVGGGGSRPAWLLLEWIDRGRAGRDYGERLGEGLAALHGCTGTTAPGWPMDNWIGSLPQANGRAGDWGAFWRDRRIGPQLELARTNRRLAGTEFDRLLEVVPVALEGVAVEGILHGDLWSGNVFPDGDGRPVLIDPATYHGAGEVDLAMAELFGGLPDGMRAAYHAIRPISAEYAEFRRALYQLYYLLVHVNLFGVSYEAACRQAARRVVGAVG